MFLRTCATFEVVKNGQIFAGAGKYMHCVTFRVFFH